MVSEQNTQLSDQQIAKLAYDAGFRGSQIGVMTAIVLAESGGQTHPVDNTNVDSHGNVTSIDRGLVQINSTHTEFTGNPYDPAQAMAFAKKLFDQRGGNWTDWTTYTQGVFNKYLSRGQTAQRTLNEPASGPAGIGTIGSDIGSAAGNAGGAIKDAAGNVIGNIPGLGQVQDAATSAASAAGAVKDAVGSIGGTLADAKAALTDPEHWKRFAVGWIALILIPLGIIVIAWPALRGAAETSSTAAAAA